MPFSGGLLYSDSGQLNVTPRPSGGMPANTYYLGGWARNNLGYAYVEDAGSAVPATAVCMGGKAFTPDGALYVTSETPTGSLYSGGIRIRNDGAVYVKGGAPAAGDPIQGLWARSISTGQAYLGGLSFWLPLNDSGSGAVNTTPAFSAGSPTATFTRATAAQALLSDGTFATVVSGTARSWYLPNGLYGGYIAEGARTNRCVRSQSFGSDWSAVGTPTRSAATTVLGVCQLDTIGDDSAAALEGYTLAVTYVGDAVKAVSVAVKKDTSTSSAIRLRDGTAGANRLLAVITWNGSVPVVTMTTGTDLTGTPQQLGTSGVYILSFQTTAVTAANANQLEIYPATDAGLAVGGTGNIQVGLVQEEDAAFASSPIITSGAVVTRNADVLTYAFAGNADAAAGSAYAELSTEWNAGAGVSVAAISFANGATGAALFAANATNDRIATNDGATNVTKTGLASMFTAVRKRASAWGGVTLTVTGDGATVASGVFDGAMESTGLAIGCGTGGAVSWYGTLKGVRLYAAQLPDATLQALTS